MSAKSRKTQRAAQNATTVSTRARPQASREIAKALQNQAREAAPRFVLPLILFVFVALAFALIIRVPWGAAPDEAAHVLYVESLATTRQLPVFTATSANAPGYEFHQPPLYYAVCALFWNAAGAGVQNYLCRVVSLVCGALALILLWRATRLIFPNRPRVAILATGFAALWPMHLGVSAAAGNDAMAGLVCAAIFFQIARIFSAASTRARDFLLLGALCGLGILAKTTCLVACVAALGASWFAAQNSLRATENDSAQSDRDAQNVGEPHRESGTQGHDAENGLTPPIALLLVLGAMLLIGGPWLVRNQMLYGDVLAQGVFNRAFSQSSPSPQMFFAGGVSLPDYLRALLTILFCTFWGVFGGPETANRMLNPFGFSGPKAEALNAMPLALICLVATVLALWGLTRFARDAWQKQPIRVRRVLAWWFLGALGVALAFVQFNTHYYQAQARYFHPALLPLALGFALGWLELFAPSERSDAKTFDETEVAAPPIFYLATALFALSLLALSLWNILAWRTLV